MDEKPRNPRRTRASRARSRGRCAAAGASCTSGWRACARTSCGTA